MDEPSAQLSLDIRDSLVRSLAERRPILHHLNADTTWLLQLPRPATAAKLSGRIYYNILIDPWLTGGQSDVARWFSQQWHATASACQSIADIEVLAKEIEILAGGLRISGGNRRRSKGRRSGGTYDDDLDATASAEVDVVTLIDAVVISHEFTDHCHKETLMDIVPDVPVFAPDKAAALIRGWSHFHSVFIIPPFTPDSPDWRFHSIPPLPEWVSISRLMTASNALYYHSAIMIAFSSNPSGTSRASTAISSPHSAGIDSGFNSSSEEEADSLANAAEAVIYTPHGIQYESLNVLSQANPSIRPLAFLHGLHSVSIGNQQQLNLGGVNGLQSQRILNARYWVGTHDEVKKGGGLISWFLRRKVYTLQDAIEEERRARKLDGSHGARADSDAMDEDDEWTKVNFAELKNGESLVLV